MSVKLKYIAPVLAGVMVGSAAVVCFAGGEKQESVDIAKSRPVKTLSLGREGNQSKRVYPGKVRASKRVNLSFETGGTLRYLPVREGMRVKKGDVLARLDQRDYINNLNSAKARFTEANLRFERSKKLRKEGIMAQSGFDAVKADYDTALAAYEISKKALEDTELRAPFNGIVSRRYVENFEHINAHSNILSLKDVRNIEIVIQLPEAEMIKKSDVLGQGYEVAFEALPERKFPAKVKEYSVEADTQTQTYELVVLLEPFEGSYNILPGMTAQVTPNRADDGGEGKYILPSTALFGDVGTQKSFVYVVDKNTMKLRKVEVEVGLPTTAGIPVLGGLKGDEEVVATGCAYLKPGMPVRIMKKY